MKSINYISFILFVLLIFSSILQPQSYNYNEEADTTKPIQYRRGIKLQEGYQSYEQKYLGKNLNESALRRDLVKDGEKRRLFPLQSTGVWTELNPKVPRVDYLGINFVNIDTGWAVGDLGAVLKTTDGGQSWSVSETNTTTPILKVRSYNGQLVIASGFNGLILRSTDGGETFTQVTSNVTGDLWGLQMINDTLGWACGTANSLVKTTDGGISWQTVPTPGYTSDYWWIDFLNENYGFIAANGKVLRTIDGGQNWEIIQAGDSYPLFTIDVIDSLHIAAAGYGGTGYPAKNTYSSDGGNTWVNGGTVTTHEINCIKYINTDTGYIVMSEIGIYKTTNRGQNWNFVPGIEGVGEYELSLLPENVGYSAGTNIKIYKTENGYDYWKRLIINDNFSDVFFVSEQKGFVISWSGISSPSGLYETTDGGINWERVPGAPDGTELLFLDSLTGFIGSNQIYKTTDGGVSWYVPNGGQGGAGKIFFINQEIGWAVRSNVIYKTTDRGENWFTQFTALAGISFHSIYFVDSLYGWTANTDRPYKTTDGGTNWIQQTNLNFWQTYDVYFADIDTGWITDLFEGLNKTTNSGLNWIAVSGMYQPRKFSFFPDSTHWWIYGFSNLYETTDGGTSWNNITPPMQIFSDFNAPLNWLGYGSGGLGYIIKYVDSSFVPVELISFTGYVNNNEIILQWITASELNNYGFEIQKSSGNIDWQKIGFVIGKGTSTEINHYSFTDNLFENNSQKLFYRLRQIDYDGTYEYSEIVEAEVSSPVEFSLEQNYPNPFNPSTTIKYQLPQAGNVTLKIYDILGAEVATLVNEFKNEGRYKINFDASSFASGVYIYQLRSNEFSSSKKMILMK